MIELIFLKYIFLIYSLDYPVSKTEDHEREVDKLLPHINNISCIVKAARELWKKWIILKMVFKIPKIDRPKEGIHKFSIC